MVKSIAEETGVAMPHFFGYMAYSGAILLPIFAAAIVGGLGNPLGAVAGGFIVAFSEVAVTYPWKKVANYLGFQPEGLLQLLSTEYKFAVSFVILIVVLLFRPTGLFRGKSV